MDRDEEPGTPKNNNNIGNPTEPGSERVDAEGTPQGQMFIMQDKGAHEHKFHPCMRLGKL